MSIQPLPEDTLCEVTSVNTTGCVHEDFCPRYQFCEVGGMFLFDLKILFSPCQGEKKPEDLAILYSNRAASYLKEGNCAECVKDCNM